ncbi:MAG: VOC family protein [Stackebrandtia sp.]
MAQQQAAMRAQQRARQRTRTQPRKAAGATKARPAQGSPLRGWRSWWATHEMDRRGKSRRGAAASSQVGGGFGMISNWGPSQVATVFSLLLLTMFTGAIALGAQSMGVAVVAFVFFAAALAIVTAARAGHHFRSHPADPQPPLEKVADFRIDDLEFDDAPADSEVNSMDDLDRSFRDKPSESDSSPAAEAPAADAAPAAAPPAPRKSPEQESPAFDDTAQEALDLAVSAAPPVSGEESRPSAHEPTAAAAEATATDTPSEAVTVTDPEPAEQAEDAASVYDVLSSPIEVDETDRDAEPSAEAEPPAAAEAVADVNPYVAEFVESDPVEPTVAEAEPSGDADSEPTRLPAEEAETEPAAADASASESAVPAASSTSGVVTAGIPLGSTPSDNGSDAAHSAEERLRDAKPETSLSLLAAETPDVDLLSIYASSPHHLPPEAVRDVAATLIVADLDQSLWFYTELLGLVEIDRAHNAVLLEAGFGRVLLWRRDDAPGAGDPVMHLTFEVGDVDAAYDALRSRGVTFTHAPHSALTGEVHDLRAASFLDPDGHGLAITELRQR